jgi:hypothetical protein
MGDLVFNEAVEERHLACIDVLLSHRCPYFPLIYNFRSLTRGGGEDNSLCLQHLLYKGCSIHPGTLIRAAQIGDLDTLRFLHCRGAPLREAAYDEQAHEDQADSTVPLNTTTSQERSGALMDGRTATPQSPQDADAMWAALRYGWVMGAPVTPVMEDMFKAQRAATRATLLSFHVSSRLSRGEGTSEQRDTWGVMGRVPIHVIEKIILGANFEICETLHRPFQSGPTASVRVGEVPEWWSRGGPIRVYATPVPDNA